MPTVCIFTTIFIFVVFVCEVPRSCEYFEPPHLLLFLSVRIWDELLGSEGSLYCVAANVMDCDIVVSEFEFQSCYYVHFYINIFEKDVDSLFLLSAKVI